MADQERAGARIARIRKTRGWTGRELASRAHVSCSLLAKVESGAAPASPALIGAVARALRVDVPRITGQPYEEPPRGQAGRLHGAIAAIRRSIDTYDLPDEAVTPRPLAALAADVQRISALGQAARFAQIGDELPGLLDELSVAVHSAPEADRPPLFGLLAEAYSGGSAIANLLGYLDLRNQVIERIRWASGHSGERVRSDLGDNLAGMGGPALSVYGSSHLRSAILAARAAKTTGPGSAQSAWAHIEAAGRVAAQIGRDRNDYGLAFGPSNVAQHAVAVAVAAARRGREELSLFASWLGLG